ncbi:MAG: dUTP diphosphatase [Pseudomonadota bacterium]
MRSVAEQLETMARMQEAHNLEVHPEWRQQDYAYYRAIWVECAELLDHFGWKWWKQQSRDLAQVQLELVDIWHFGLSDLLRADAALADVADALERLGSPVSVSDDAAEAFRVAVERLAENSLAQKRFDLAAFLDAMTALPMTATELFELYVGKNVLNSFRQRNGYKSGSYRKTWADGREDNEHLIERLRALDCQPAEVPTALMAALEVAYQR